MSTTFFVLKLLVAYLLGSVSGALLIGRFRRIDIRTQGSGNAGGTNAFRTQGAAFAAGVVAIDVGKGVLAVLLGDIPIGPDAPSTLAQALACGFACAIGHVWPVFFGFRGGKGAATLLGVLLAIAPGAAIIPVLAWLGTLATTGYVGLSTVFAGLALPVTFLLVATGRTFGPLMLFGLAAAALLVVTHRDNLRRVRDGTEPRFERARVIGRMIDRDGLE
jgi:acyl phosphate:glycerol-3-phosphate acyltransferase